MELLSIHINGNIGYLVGFLLICVGGGGSMVICTTIADKIEIWAKKRHSQGDENNGVRTRVRNIQNSK